MAKFERYSAVGIFGVPLYNPEAQLSLGGLELVKYMQQHDIYPQPLPEEPTDISPYYGNRALFSYFLSYTEEKNLATVELLPRRKDSQLIDPGLDTNAISDIRTIYIPTDKEMFAIVGPSPRYGDTLCVHELVAYTE